MADSKIPDDRLSVAIVRRIALVRVEGRGSYKISTPMKDFVQAAIAAGAESAAVDLRGCVSMDSTFMGILAGAAARLRGKAGGRLVLLNLSPKTRALISTLGLDRVVAAFDEGATPAEFLEFERDTHLETISPSGESRQATAKTVLEAHETLCDLSPDNKPRFKDVLEFLREDLQRKAEGDGPVP